MQPLKNAKWIWYTDTPIADSYGEFYHPFPYDGGTVRCRLSCDGDYTLFCNGTFVASNQYGDFEHYKIYDEIDLTPYLQTGENHFALLVWHFGFDHCSRYRNAAAGAIFEVTAGDSLLFCSDETIAARQSRAYRSGACKSITGQLGCSFAYDAAQEDDWTIGSGTGFASATLVQKECTFFPRPNRRLPYSDRLLGEVIDTDHGHRYLIDCGKETVGLLNLSFATAQAQNVMVCWGEDLENGHVRRIVGGRDFSLEYRAKAGENHYENRMLRLGCRYLAIYSEAPLTLHFAKIREQTYDAVLRPFSLSDPQDQQIYDLCTRTLQLCMSEHYVDCPWREQCLYAFDARNQMLCGYYAFQDGNRDYARSNLLLIGKDDRPDGLLSICAPCENDLTIPSFSLYYFIAVWEYTAHTKDLSLAKEVLPKLYGILNVFLQTRTDGLLRAFAESDHWNFYDWSEHLSGRCGCPDVAQPHLILNCLGILALEALQKICCALQEPFPYPTLAQELRDATQIAFADRNTPFFSQTVGGNDLTALGNALAVLAQVAQGERAQAICAALVGESPLSECSLSMKTWKYDALLFCDRQRYAPWVLDQIRYDYQKMLDCGATATWETADGAIAFDHAGSLCHGWSAIPVYYYHLLK